MTKEQTPSLARRLTAIVYDALLVIALVGVVNGLALAIQVKLTGNIEQTLNPHVAQTLTLSCVFGFFILFWLAAGQTLGMQAWRLKLISSDGSTLTLPQTLVRCLAATLSAACLGCGYLWALIDSEGKTWHDRLSRTELTLLPKSTEAAPIVESEAESKEEH